MRAAPDDHYAVYIAGVSAHQLGRPRVALERLEKAVTLDGDNETYLNNLGVVRATLGLLDGAVSAYERSLSLKPNQADTLYNIAHALARKNDVLRALSYLDRLKDLGGLTTDALMLRVRSQLALGRSREAEAGLGDVLAREGEHVEARLLLVQCLLRRKEEQAALPILLGLMPAAEEQPLLWVDVGNGLAQCEQFEKALSCYRKAIDTDCGRDQAYNNMGNILAMLGRPEEAAALFHRALEANGGLADTLSNLACVHDLMDQAGEAAPLHERALELAPENPQFNYNYAIHLFRAGDITRAVRHYRHRFQSPSWVSELGPLRLVRAPDPGDRFCEGTLVLGEQGLGDEIFLLHCLGNMARPKQWQYLGDPRVKGLCERSFPEARFRSRHEVNLEKVIAAAENAWRLDHVLLALEREGTGKMRPSLAVDPDSVERWKERLGKVDSKLKIGLSWTGGKRLMDRRVREIPPGHWVALRGVQGVTFVDIQYDDRGQERAALEQAIGAELFRPSSFDAMGNVDDGCGLLAALDLIITVDNSSAHIAGALGAEGWILLPKVPDWRWREDGSLSSSWYPTLSLYRQKKRSEWSDPLRHVKADLDRWIKCRPPGGG